MVNWLAAGVIAVLSLLAVLSIVLDWYLDRRTARRVQQPHRHTRRNIIISWGPPYSSFLGWREEFQWQQGHPSFGRQTRQMGQNMHKLIEAMGRAHAQGMSATEAMQRFIDRFKEAEEYHKRQTRRQLTLLQGGKNGNTT